MDRPDAGAARTGELQLRYRGLRRLLAANSEMLEWMADLEADLHHLHPGEHQIRQPVKRLLEGSLLLAENLNVLTGHKYEALYDAHRSIETAVRKYLASLPAPSELPLVAPLRESSLARVRDVGGKAAQLGELRMLMPDAVAQGFVVTTAAYRLFIEENELHAQLRTLLKDLSLVTGRELFKERLAAARVLITASPVPGKVAEAIADGVVGFALPWPSRWAVRSSAVGEDGRMSFAGQFDSVLNVPTDRLRDAYKQVIASRFTERAMLYRLIGGFTEVDTPMAVLFLPMIEALSAGVLYTRDPADEAADAMIISSVWGLADGLVRGEAAADTFVARRSRPGEIVEQRLAERAGDAGPSLTPDDVKLLVETGARIEEHFGRPQDIEWVLTPAGKLMIVQSRRLRTEERRIHSGQSLESRPPLLDGGVTIFPGRAVGPAFVAAETADVGRAGEGAVLVVRQATPELGAVLPNLAGVISEQGSPSGHAATLLREFGVPAVFGMDGASRLKTGQVVSLDATHRKAYEGELWPEVRERVKARIAQGRSGKPQSPLNDLVLTLNLTDPLSMSFRPKGCKSVHDIVRFTHEKAVAAMFELGDESGGRARQTAWRLDSPIALNIYVLDLGGALPEKPTGKKGMVKPEEIRSVPFQALWRGVSDPAVSWAGRSRVSGAGFMSVMAASMADRGAAVRGLGNKNYLMVAPEYVNLNARLAYHFAMVDALVGEVPENNYVNFRFRGGGAGADRRSLRAEFLSRVLLQESFAVDRRGDLVTAWLARYPGEASEAALALLGRLMGCARQLDMLLDSEAAVAHFAERFRAGDYKAFA